MVHGPIVQRHIVGLLVSNNGTLCRLTAQNLLLLHCTACDEADAELSSGTCGDEAHAELSSGTRARHIIGFEGPQGTSLGLLNLL